MGRQFSAGLLAFLIGVVAVLGGAAILKGGFYIGKHEGDTLHLMQIVFRMAEGQMPHQDFMTPIGALAFAPIVLFVQQGLGIGMAILWSQILVAALLVPAAWWIAQRRLSPTLAGFFGLTVAVLALALVHGEAQRSVSISMHYNRWAWAAAFIAILGALVPPVGRARAIDGVVIGSCMAVLVMIKVTYFAAFVIPVALALVLTGQGRALLAALATGLVIMGGLTAWLGVGYWMGYLGDLLTVAGSEVRAQPGEPLGAVVGAPAYIGGSLLAVMGVILLRQAGAMTGGLVLLLLLPGFFYVTFQNFGNDPQWLLLLAVLLFALRPEGEVRNGSGWDMRQALGIAGAMALALAAPSFFNLAYSPFRHLNTETETYAPILPRGGVHEDLQSVGLRVLRVDARVALDGPGSGLEAYREDADRDPPSEFRGEVFPYCSVELGLPSVFDAIVRDLEEAGLAEGKRIFAADLFSSHWLFGAPEPLVGGAPWYYGGLPGYDSADYLLIPLCPVTQDVQADILTLIEERGTEGLTEIRRTPLYVLYQKDAGEEGDEQVENEGEGEG